MQRASPLRCAQVARASPIIGLSLIRIAAACLKNVASAEEVQSPTGHSRETLSGFLPRLTSLPRTQ